MDTALAFSGGVDSVYCLWDYLKRNPRKKILIHHVKMSYCNNEVHKRRQTEEYRSVKKILNWLNNNGFKNRVKYYESILDYGTITTATYDIIATAFYTGVLLKKHRNIKYVISSTNLNEGLTLDLEEIKAKKKRADRHDLIKLIACREDIEMTYPIYTKDKTQLIKEMPKSLFELCWYCRTPTENNQPCKKCFTCKSVMGKDNLEALGGEECVWNT